MSFDLQQLIQTHRGQSLSLAEQHINPQFAKVMRVLGFDVHYARGQGAYLYDDQGRRYIDCLSGFGVFACGRNHPVIRDAIKQAMDLDLPNLPKFGPALLSGILAQRLIELAPGDLDTVFFCNSGAEGVEAAIKYARAATGREKIVYCKKAYHGLTLGALACNGGTEFREGFGAMMPGCVAVPFNDLPTLEAELAKRDAAAFLVEPIQGKGVAVPGDDYLPQAAALCRKHGSLFIADEVQTGLGRTGRMFAVEHWGVEPDILVISKALSGGYVPVAATLSKRWIHNKVFSSLDRCMVHSTTFSQNDLAMTAGLATLHVLQHEKLVENADRVGTMLMQLLREKLARFEMFREVRGKGVMIAVEFGPPRSLGLKMGWALLHKVDAGLFPQAILIPLLKDHRILAQVAGHHQDVIKLLPPLVLSEDDARQIAEAFEATVAACHKFPGPAWEVGRRLAKQALKRDVSPEPAPVTGDA